VRILIAIHKVAAANWRTSLSTP